MIMDIAEHGVDILEGQLEECRVERDEWKFKYEVRCHSAWSRAITHFFGFLPGSIGSNRKKLTDIACLLVTVFQKIDLLFLRMNYTIFDDIVIVVLYRCGPGSQDTFIPL